MVWDQRVWIVVGLGNPGKYYALSRHNAGFMVVQRLFRRWGFSRWQKKFLSRMSRGQRGEETVYLLLPQTFMNRSGEAVLLAQKSLQCPLERLVVVYDDLDLPLGSIRVRREGGPGTHRGMQSIVEALGSESFPRVRVGIGPLPEGADAASFVLESFTAEERALVEPAIEDACQAIEMTLEGAIDRAMNTFNRKQT